MSNTLNRRQFNKLMTAGAAGLTMSGFDGMSDVRKRSDTDTSSQSIPDQRPNIVLITADDLGYNHLGCYGQAKIRTPNIDRLAKEGMRFTQAYAGCTVCAPSRCTLMTGYHQGHCSVRGNSGGIPLLPEDTTVAEVLKEAGYTTGCFGKWGLGDARTTGVPTRQGFDEYFGTLDQVHAHFYYPEYLWHNEEKYPLPGNKGNRREQYTNDLFTEFALNFVRNQADADNPFFCYVPYTIPHTELLVPESSLQEYLDEDGNSVFPETPFEYEGHYAGQKAPRAAFAAMVTRLDSYVGRILDLLEEQGLAENTLVIFTSDNGGQRNGAGVDLAFFQGNWPLRGWKGNFYEGGIRVPAIMRWPGRISKGAVSHQVWAQWDFLPTAAEVAGTASPVGIDGLSIVPALLGKAEIERNYLYWEVTRRGELYKAVRMGDWKAVRNGDENTPVELYHLPTDTGEKFNLASNYPKQLERAEHIFKAAHTEPRAQIEPETGNDLRYR